MVEADSHLKLFFTSILDIQKVFDHTDMLSIGIQQLGGLFLFSGIYFLGPKKRS